MNLLADQIYNIEFIPGKKKPNFSPENVSVDIRDAGPCDKGITLRFRQDKKRPWVLKPTDKIMPKYKTVF